MIPADHVLDANNYCATCGYQKGTEGLKYTLNSDGVSYSVIGIGTASGTVVIGSLYEGKPVTSIGYQAFEYCRSLTSITIPSSVTSIGEYAFCGCDSLTVVYYGGSASNWSSIAIDSSNSNLTSATRYYFSAKEPTTAGSWWYYDSNGQPAIWPAVEE